MGRMVLAPNFKKSTLFAQMLIYQKNEATQEFHAFLHCEKLGEQPTSSILENVFAPVICKITIRKESR